MISRIVGGVIGNLIWLALLACILLGNEQAQNVAIVFYWVAPLIAIPIGILFAVGSVLNEDKEKAKKGLPLLGGFGYVLGGTKTLITFGVLAYSGFMFLAGYYLLLSIVCMFIYAFCHYANKETLAG